MPTIRCPSLPLLLSMLPLTAQAPAGLTSPTEAFGHPIGADYYTELSEYWAWLDAESERMEVVSLGNAAGGAPHRICL